MFQYDWKGDGRTADVRFFDSVGEFAATTAKIAPKYHKDTDFYGGKTADSVKKAATGATEAEMKPVLALMDKIDAEARGREMDMWLPSPVGAYPCVPEVLMGLPDNMRAKQKIEADRSPIRLFVEVVTSAGVQASLLKKRGAALAALAMRMKEIRPVELFVVCAVSTHNSKHTVTAIKLSTLPLAPAEIAFACADPCFTRGMLLVEVLNHTKTSEHDSLPFLWNESPSSKGRVEKVRRALGMTDADLFLPGGHLTEQDDWAKDPVAWVHKYLDAQREVE